MTYHRVRVEGEHMQWTAYHGMSAEAASDALRLWPPDKGQRAVWEVEEREGWRVMVEIFGGHLTLCPRCDGDPACWKCHGRGVV